MIIPFYKNTILFLAVSLIFGSNIPTADAGQNIDEFVTSCIDKNIVVSVDGSSSNLPDRLGVCDTGICSNNLKYCETNNGIRGEECLVTDEDLYPCGQEKICIGGDNEGLVCSGDDCGVGGVCDFLKKCVSRYNYQAYCEDDQDSNGEPDGVWLANYEYIEELACDEYGNDTPWKNHKWYDYSLSYNWESNSENLVIANKASVVTDIVFNPLSSLENQIDSVYLIVSNTFADTVFVDTSYLSIDLDPKLPCAVSGDDIYLCRACGDTDSQLYNSDYVDTVLSVIQLDASGSYSYSGDDFSYLWSAPVGFSLSDPNILNPQLIMGFPDNNYKDMKKAVHVFTLEITDNISNLVSKLDTLTIYMNPSRPAAPKVEVYPENDKITLNWARNASMFSMDSLSGYSDFEGYRVYKSIDGGKTWGSADDKIFYDGSHVGWRHESQSDLSELQDSQFCNKGLNLDLIGEGLVFKNWEDCVEGMEAAYLDCCNEGSVRGSSISGLDSYSPWINLGDDSGLNFSYIDTSVYNGKEYTYAVVAYDIGLQSYANETSATGNGICVSCTAPVSETVETKENCCIANGGVWGNDDNCTGSCDNLGHLWTPTYEYVQTWSATNPEQFTYNGVLGFSSMESELIDSFNVVTAIPAFYAENVGLISNFIDINKDFGVPAKDKLWTDSTSTAVGNGGIYFQIINPYNITDKSYQFQIKADYAGSDVEIFEGYKTESPRLYAWELNEDSNPATEDVAKISEEGLVLTPDEICELMGLPGSRIDGVCSRYTKVCVDGSKDGKECTYDEDYCTNGACNESDINYLDNYYACLCDDILADLSGAEGDLDGLASEYNTWITDSDSEELQDLNTIYYPFYEIEDFAVKYLYQDGYDENYTDFLDGLKFIFNNNVEKVEDLDDGKVKVNTLQSFNADSIKTSLSDNIFVALEYGNGGSVFDNKPSYSYRIEFSDSAQYASSVVTPSGGCSGRPNSLLPFRVINTTTDKVVGINHVDKGGFYDESGTYNAFGTCVEDGNPCSQNEYCDINECKELKGYGDCTWEKNERTSFTRDTVHVGLTARETPEYTFDLKIDYRAYSLYTQGINPGEVGSWLLGFSYETNDVVKYNDMYWKATALPNPLVSPVQWVDNGNGGNANSWAPVYPWDEGDYIIIEPTRWYVDGDVWIADLSALGKNQSINEKSLEKISVVPNPYLVHSDYDETPNTRRLWFNHLPNKCRITIYTISGERVASILHDDDALSGKESWDLRSQGGDLVAPGLYIYTVESVGMKSSGVYGDIKYISKFAIVR